MKLLPSACGIAARPINISLHSSNPKPLMSVLGQKRTLTRSRHMSALPPKADMDQRRL